MDKEIYARALSLLSEDKTQEALDLLESVEDKDAEWHYLGSRIYLAKNWTNESRQQLEIAIELAPDNKQYRRELAELRQYMNGLAEEPQDKGGTANGSNGGDEQLGSGCAECCCEGVCGGLCGG
ncbi:MAG: tetratricopeptide repeat protein [Clostridia bacterium]|nr:tetratricopeptide repeat protein [Clostridia bacterium]